MTASWLNAAIEVTDGSSLRVADYVFGAAIFDANGLLTNFAQRGLGNHMEWVQATFNSLCLESLLAHGFQLKTVQHLLIRGTRCDVLLIRHRQRYVGLLLDKTLPAWVSELILEHYRAS
jgi:hypothetical protein